MKPATDEVLLSIPGPEGAIQAIQCQPANSDLEHFAILCHPHPLYGGTMQNKVVTTMARTFRDLGVASIRFNYRGVGESAGQYGDIQGECEDAEAVLAWVKEKTDARQLYFAGFSFGSYIALHLTKTELPQALITIAPSVANMPYDTVPVPNCPWAVFQGEDDEIVSCAQVAEYISNISNAAIHFQSFPETSHFFHGKLILLQQKMTEYLQHLQGS